MLITPQQVHLIDLTSEPSKLPRQPKRTPRENTGSDLLIDLTTQEENCTNIAPPAAVSTKSKRVSRSIKACNSFEEELNRIQCAVSILDNTTNSENDINHPRTRKRTKLGTQSGIKSAPKRSFEFDF